MAFNWASIITAFLPKPKPKGRTEAQKLRRRIWESTPEFKAKMREYRKTPQFKAKQKRYLQTDKGRKSNAASTKRWREKKRREAQ